MLHSSDNTGLISECDGCTLTSLSMTHFSIDSQGEFCSSAFCGSCDGASLSELYAEGVVGGDSLVGGVVGCFSDGSLS